MLTSQTPTFHELAEAVLIDIRTTSDRILKLENSRLWLRDSVETHSQILPIFVQSINTYTAEVSQLVQRARQKLREYFKKY